MGSGKKKEALQKGESVQGGGGDVLLLDDGTTTKSQHFMPPTRCLWPPLSDITLHLWQDIFLSCPRMMSCNNQTPVNMDLVVTSETKLAFIPDKSF